MNTLYRISLIGGIVVLLMSLQAEAMTRRPCFEMRGGASLKGPVVFRDRRGAVELNVARDAVIDMNDNALAALLIKCCSNVDAAKPNSFIKANSRSHRNAGAN
jgi:hypothetical protein